MKKILVASLSLSLLIPLNGCALTDFIGCIGKPELKIYNWGEYIASDVLSAFEDEYNVCISYSTFPDNETAVTKMQTEAFDVVIPSDYAIEQLVSLNLLSPIDWDKITNLSQDDLTSGLKVILDRLNTGEDGFDFLAYAVPYFWGNMGILYNPEVVDASRVEEEQWDILRQEDLKTAFYNSSRDAFMVALVQLGYSPNETQIERIEEAKEWLLEQRDIVGTNLYYVGDEVIDDMIGSRYDVALVYSGDATYILQENPDLVFYTPTIGTNVWADGMVVPTNAPNKELAYAFINFMVSYDSALANTEEVGYVSPIQAVFDDVKMDYFADQADSYQISLNENDEIYRFNDALKVYLAEAWSDIKAD